MHAGPVSYTHLDVYKRQERLVGKKMLETYAGYIPEDQQIGIFKVIDSRFKGNKDAFIDACFKLSLIHILLLLSGKVPALSRKSQTCDER